MAGREETATLDTTSISANGDGKPTASVTTFGRYVVRGELGRGGMGEVFLAHDPELDRLVAVKVVRTGLAERSPEARARFQREAQALARLNHPNVVAIHDVGTVGDIVYVAMERIAGPTLAQWLADHPHSIEEILNIFAQAGAGLAAAHDAGLVHRDFRPSNVMLGDRVRVVDFGLARNDSSVDPLASTLDGDAELGALDATITAAGRVLGTPAYMAPEQRDAQRTSPATDQYSFAVALREAVTRGSPRNPVERSAPRWLQRILARALAFEPEARYPSMHALLSAIERGRTRSRRWVTLAIGTAATGMVIGVWMFAAASVPKPCSDPAPLMANVWGPSQRTAVRAAFLATKQPYAEQTWRTVERALDDYTGTWKSTTADACRATRLEGRLSPSVLDRKTTCLERARAEIASLITLWTTGTDAKALADATNAVASLPSLAACSDIDQLLGRVPPPTDPALVTRIATMRTAVDQLHALSRAGRHEQVAAEVSALVTAADGIGWSPLRAEVRFLQAHTSSSLWKPEAEQQLLAANQLATEAKDDRLAAQVMIELVRVLGADASTAPRALLAAKMADAALSRLHGDRQLAISLMMYRADALTTLEKLPESKALLVQARDLATSAFGENSRSSVELQLSIAMVVRKMGEVTEAGALAETALARLTALVGSDHPMIATALTELAARAKAHGDYDAVVDYMTRTMAIISRTMGDDSLAMAKARWNLAQTQLPRGRFDEAERLFTQSLEVRERLLGKDHVDVARSLEGLAQVQQWRGKLDPALALMQRALAIKTKVLGPDSADVAYSLASIGAALVSNKANAEGLRYHQRALELRSRVLGKEDPSTIESEVLTATALAILDRCRDAHPLLDHAIIALEQLGGDASTALEIRAECELEANDAAAAATTALRAITACEATSKDNPMCSERYFVRARALAKLGKTDEARAAATEAARRADANDSPEEASEIRTWIARLRR